MKKYIQKMTTPKSALLILLAALIVLVFQSCMETTAPSNEEIESLTVKVLQVNPNNPTELLPLRGVDVVINETGLATDIANVQTNEQGIAIFGLNIPLIGRNYDVRASFNNLLQVKQAVLVCRDTLVVFLFDNQNVPTIDCQTLNGRDSLIFLDETGSREITQNTPQGVNRYDKCWSISNSVTNTESITATIPTISSDVISLSSIWLDGVSLPLTTKQVAIPAGGTLTLCFAVRTDVPPGTKVPAQPFELDLRCSTSQGKYRLDLRADIVEPVCDCNTLSSDSYDLRLPVRVEVGKTLDHSESVFTNILPCTVTITQASFEGNNAWTILGPTFPVTLQPGQSLTLNVRFAPKQSGTTPGLLRLSLQPQGSGSPCDYDVNLEADGCSAGCPLISKSSIGNYSPFGRTSFIDTLSNRTDNRVFVNAPDVPPTTNSTGTGIYYVMNPDSACAEIVVNVMATPKDNYASQYYSVSPSILRLAPGESGIITVEFVAPLLNDFKTITQARGNTGKLTDSLFQITITLSSGNCTQKIEDNAVVTTYPDLSPIINLRAYSQRTPQKPLPEKEVYTFGNDSRTINKNQDGTGGEYPPLKGDIYVDVPDTNASANPPQEPIIKMVDPSITWTVWKQNYPESQFDNVVELFNLFRSELPGITNWQTGPITNISVGDVIAFKLGSNVYALIYIRRIDNGTENTSSKQSGIEFRSIYPVYP
jgi:hypothetical protein